mgnify:CR=1 FL=1
MSQSIVIIGAGPAGLTAAYELLKKGQVSVTILEATGEIGGISRTKNYKGNRMDIGGHRFFSKSDKAMDFWKEIMPLEDRERGISPDQADLLFLIRHRLSRILFLRKFFDYPVTLNGSTIRGLAFPADENRRQLSENLLQAGKGHRLPGKVFYQQVRRGAV